MSAARSEVATAAGMVVDQAIARGSRVGARPPEPPAEGASSLPSPKSDAAFELVSAGDFAAQYTPLEFVWDGIAARGFLYSWTGRTGHGKTAVALTFAVSVALGRELCGRSTTSGPVIYIASENPEDVRVRFMALCERLRCAPGDLDGRLFFLTRSFVLGACIGTLCELFEQVKPVLILVDTDQAVSGATDDDSNAERLEHAKTLRILTRLRSRPCVIDLCHPSKSATRQSMVPRGGSSFVNEVDGNAGIWLDDGASITELFRTSKYRGPVFDDLAFELETVSTEAVVDRVGRPVETVIATPMAASREVEIHDRAVERRLVVMRDIASKPKDSLRARANRTGISKTQVGTIIGALLNDKLIEHDEIDKQTLALTPKGRQIVGRHSGRGVS